ncbi:MAG: hypothetical protein JWL61_5350 [Gemmatimonadetes bacterium]|nr:hypothetical protein [Gemmatimonadota bacterium]
MKFSTRVRALPLGLLAVVTVVALSALFARDPLWDAATFENLLEVSLRRPAGYLLLAPISNVLDTLTLLSLRQHIALLATILVCYAIWWWFFGRAQLAELPPNRRALREIARIGVGLVVVIGVYVVGMIVPRPMAGIEAATDIIVIDFHAHTKFSHDGRPDWRPEDVRAWHRAAGFDVAYVTDHRTFEGARDAWANNPLSAGTATVLLPGIEVVWRGEHVNVLDADRMFRGLLTETLRDIDEKALTIASTLPGNEPVLIETFPGDLSKVVTAAGPGTGGIRAIEIIDGAPQGLGQTRRERARILHLADSTNLALVAGSNHHGWGHTAAGWTLMFLPQWRAATPEQLSAGISKNIRGGGRTSTRVVERYVADTETGIALPLTVPLVAWGMLRTLSNDERIVWLAWTAALYLMWRFRRARLNRTAER